MWGATADESVSMLISNYTYAFISYIASLGNKLHIVPDKVDVRGEVVL